MQFEQNSINQVFQFSKLTNSNNKLVNKKLNIIHVDEKNNIIECKDTENEPTVTKAEHSLNLENCVSYFQVQVLRATQEDTINIGLMSKDCNNKSLIGKSTNSFGYFKGDLYLDKKKVSISTLHDKLKQNDRIGIGINCHKRMLFVVKNELIIQKDISIPSGWNDFFPAVALSSQREKVQFHFNLEKLKFKLNDFCKSIQNQRICLSYVSLGINTGQQLFQQQPNIFFGSLILIIQQLFINFILMYLLVNLVKQKKIDYHKLSKYTKNPSIITPEINLEKKVQEGMDQEMNEPLKIRNRIMSQRLNDDEEGVIDMRRKNTEMIIEQMHVPRKCSLISNISNISNAPNIPFSNLSEEKSQFKQEEYQILQEITNQNEYFLQNQRHRIIENIKNKKIQEAIEIMQKYIPKIFQEKYLMAFMKAHIFLKKVKEESNKQAISYSKRQKQFLKDNYGVLCPFYCSVGKKVDWKPLSTVFLAMTYNTQTECKLSQSCLDLVSDEQFNTFANYVNRLILKKMGYLSCSRLTYFTNHMKKIQQKLKEFKGMSCGIEFNL